MEDVSVRAITIGVGVLLAIITMSAVFSYYNTAKQAVRDIGAGTDIAGLYEKSVRDILVKAEGGSTTITGTDVKNLLYYSLNDETLKFESFINIKLLNDLSDTSLFEKVNVNTDESGIKKIIKKILPNSKYKLENINGKYRITGQD